MTGAPGAGARRIEVVDAARRLDELGLNQGTSGNVSARLPGGGFLVTPSGIPPALMEPEDVVELGLDGEVRAARAGRLPSTEWRMHAGVLAERPDTGAVVHAHPPWATALACLRREIPAFHYMVAVAGASSIRCAAYATFGTPELARSALAALDGGRGACLLANHGLLACGESLARALALAVEVEALAGQYLRALSAGEPILLDGEEMDRVRVRFRDYGG